MSVPIPIPYHEPCDACYFQIPHAILRNRNRSRSTFPSCLSKVSSFHEQVPDPFKGYSHPSSITYLGKGVGSHVVRERRVLPETNQERSFSLLFDLFFLFFLLLWREKKERKETKRGVYVRSGVSLSPLLPLGNPSPKRGCICIRMGAFGFRMRYDPRCGSDNKRKEHADAIGRTMKSTSARLPSVFRRVSKDQERSPHERKTSTCACATPRPVREVFHKLATVRKRRNRKLVHDVERTDGFPDPFYASCDGLLIDSRRQKREQRRETEENDRVS